MKAIRAMAEEANLVVGAFRQAVGYALADDGEYPVEMLAYRSPELHEGLELGPGGPTQPPP